MSTISEHKVSRWPNHRGVYIYTMLTIVREVAHYVDFMTEELWFACSNLSDFIND